MAPKLETPTQQKQRREPVHYHNNSITMDNIRTCINLYTWWLIYSPETRQKQRREPVKYHDQYPNLKVTHAIKNNIVISRTYVIGGTE
ncbi:hypothetical protein TNCV_851361 [Trichonephila clavipes]|nr:hypothetical protein TNCV_851361 [Trichonephila clavipes]